MSVSFCIFLVTCPFIYAYPFIRGISVGLTDGQCLTLSHPGSNFSGLQRKICMPEIENPEKYPALNQIFIWFTSVSQERVSKPVKNYSFSLETTIF